MALEMPGGLAPAEMNAGSPCGLHGYFPGSTRRWGRSGFDPSEHNSSSYRLFCGSCDPPLFCGPTLWFTKIFIREINEP